MSLIFFFFFIKKKMHFFYQWYKIPYFLMQMDLFFFLEH